MRDRANMDSKHPQPPRAGDRLLAHSLLLMVFTHTANAAHLCFHVVMGRTLLEGEYGVLSAMINLVLALQMPMVAVQTTVAHFAAHMIAENRGGDLRRLAARWALRTGAAGAALFLLALAFSGPLSGFFHLASRAPLLWAAAGAVPALVLPVFVGLLQGSQRFVWMSLAWEGWGLLRLALALALISLFGATATAGLAAQSCALAVGLCVALWGTARMFSGGGTSSGPRERTGPYFLLAVGSLGAFSVLTYADTALVKHFFAEPRLYGPYARASQLARMVFYLTLPVAAAMFPKAVSRTGRRAGHGALLLRAVALAGLVAGAGVVAVFLSGPLLYGVLFKEPHPSAADLELMRTLVAAMAALSMAGLLLYFELAQNSFAAAGVVAACAAVFLGGAWFMHPTPLAVARWLAAATLAAAAGCAGVVAWQSRCEPGQGAGPPQGAPVTI
jgi:hypothetical protein